MPDKRLNELLQWFKNKHNYTFCVVWPKQKENTKVSLRTETTFYVLKQPKNVFLIKKISRLILVNVLFTSLIIIFLWMRWYINVVFN